MADRNRADRGLVAGVYLFTFLTGTAGLIYQIVWQKYLTRLLGSDSLAIAIVIGVFLAGLSLGSLLCGKLTVRTGRLFLAYAWLEGLIGIWAVAFPWLYAGVDLATSGWSFAPPWALTLQGVLCAAILIGPPTLCMGGTVPILTRCLTVSLERATPVHARVYGINAAGACVGALAAGFWLIGAFGLPWTLRVAAALNLGAAVFFALIRDRGVEQYEAVDAAKRTRGQRTGLPVPLLYAIALLAGFYFMTLETLFVRVVNLSLGASSHSFTLVVAVSVLCVAAGAVWVAHRPPTSSAALSTNLICISIGMLLLFLTLDKWPWAAHLLRIQFPDTDGGFVLFHTAVFACLSIVLLPVMGCMGATLPLIFHQLRREVHDVGLRAGVLLAWNALGNLLGALIGGYLIYRFLLIGQVFVVAIGLVVVSAGLAAVGRPARTRLAAAVVAGATAILAWSFPHEPLRFAVGTFRLRDALEHSYDGPAAFYEEMYLTKNVLAYRDDPEGTFAVVENLKTVEALALKFPNLTRSIVTPETAAAPRPRAVVVNGKPDSSTYFDRETLKLAAHLPALLAPRRARVLVIGLGTGVTAGEFTLYPDVETIDVAEIAPGVVSFLPFFERSTHRVHEDPRLRVRVGDAFRLLRRSDARWDIVTSEPSNPWTNGVDQMFSREFYRLVRDRLEPGGLFLQWVQRYDTNQSIVGIVINTLRSEFPNVRVFRARGDDFLLASDRPVTLENFARAGKILAGNPRLIDSLGTIQVFDEDDLRQRERPGVLRQAGQVSDLGLETLDTPRLHYMSALAHFKGEELQEE